MKITTAKIVGFKNHPESHKLKLCEVTDGKNTLTVVCGAANVQKDMITLLAPVGSRLPLGLELKEAEIRGVKSPGMLCSAKDLGVSDEGGIVHLPAGTPLGEDWSKLPKHLLSSVPWHEYRLVEIMHESSDGKILFQRNEPKAKDIESLKDKLLSLTYFHEGEYHYRHF